MAHYQLITQLRRHEGFRGKPYRDLGGNLSIGYGRNLDDLGISRDEALLLLENDVERATREVRAAFPWSLTIEPQRFEALVNMNFNLGLTRLRTFKKFLAALEAGDYETAAREMLDSRWARQVGARATELSGMIASGRYPD